MTHEDPEIARRRADRLLVMNAIYEETGGSRHKFVSGPWLLENAGLPEDELADATTYLVDERLIDGTGGSWGKAIPFSMRMTHRGLKEMETARTEPTKPTTYFPPITFVSIGGDNVGSPIVAGSPGATQMATAQLGLDLAAVREVLDAYEASATNLDQNLPAVEAAQLRAEIATIRAQVDSPRPSEHTIREHIRNVRRILTENATVGAVAGAAIADAIQNLHLHW